MDLRKLSPGRADTRFFVVFLARFLETEFGQVCVLPNRAYRACDREIFDRTNSTRDKLGKVT